MKKKIRNSPQEIETIIHSMEHYALGDIRHNRSKPIAAFILSMCLIDQVSSFRYPLLRDRNKRPEDLIEEYMPAYRNLDLYDMFRHSLIHHYSSLGKFDIDNVGYENVPYHLNNNVIHINSNVFIAHLESAFAAVCEDFRRTGSDANKNAINNSMYHPVLVASG